MSTLDSEATRAITKCHVQLLAPELLAMIFHDVMALHERRPILLLPTTGKPLENEINTKPLLSLTHVCRYWRDVAIGTPALWTRVHGRHQDQMDVFLERSRPLPVTLFLDEEHQGVEWDGHLPELFRPFVRALGPRLRRLDFGMLPFSHYVVPLLASLPAPHLECLTIMSPLMGYSLLSAIYWGPLLDDASSLRALGLLPVVDWLPSSTFPNLTHLVLYGTGTEELLHPFDLLRLLCNTPALEFLHVGLFTYEEPYRGSWQPHPDPIPLPCLRSLVVTDCPYELLNAVFPRLSLPADVFIRLQGIANFFAVHGPVAQALSLLPLRPVTHLDVAIRGEELLMVADGPTSGLWLDARHDLDGFPEPQDWGSWLLTLHKCLTLSHITHLHIYVGDGEMFWPTFLTHFPQLSHLAALLGHSNGERGEFSGPWDTPTAILCDRLSLESHVLCPALDTLVIEWPHEITEDDFFAFPRLVEMLKARSRARHPIRRLVVQVPAESPLGPSGGNMTFLEMHKLARGSCPGGTEYEVVEKPGPQTGKGLGAFEMREVWRVGGEDRYWEFDERGKPNYDSFSRIWQEY